MQGKYHFIFLRPTHIPIQGQWWSYSGKGEARGGISDGEDGRKGAQACESCVHGIEQAA